MGQRISDSLDRIVADHLSPALSELIQAVDTAQQIARDGQADDPSLRVPRADALLVRQEFHGQVRHIMGIGLVSAYVLNLESRAKRAGRNIGYSFVPILLALIAIFITEFVNQRVDSPFWWPSWGAIVLTSIAAILLFLERYLRAMSDITSALDRIERKELPEVQF